MFGDEAACLLARTIQDENELGGRGWLLLWGIKIPITKATHLF